MNKASETDNEEKLRRYEQSVKKDNRKFAWLFAAVIVLGVIWVVLYFA